ncbi:hypothetical protein LTR95_009914, partial [Oleoguttula sp. CCFEE 5521]
GEPPTSTVRLYRLGVSQYPMPSTTRQSSTAPEHSALPNQRKTARRPVSKKQSLLASHLFPPAPPVVKVPRLLGLPVELQKDILDYITTCRDRKSLCLVSKEMHALTAPYLYRNVELSLVDLADKLKDSLGAGNRSLQHIRRLVIQAAHLEGGQLSESHVAVLSSVLTVLPKDRCRLAYRALWITRFVCDNVVRLSIHNKANCAKARAVLQAAPRVVNLAIELYGLEFDDEDGPKSAEHIVTTLFAPQDLPSGKHALVKPRLQKLRLHGLDLTDAGTVLPTLLDCRALRNVQLIDCVNMVSLCESFAQLKLALDVLDIRGATDNGMHGKTDVLLQSIRHLERFRITRFVHEEPNHDFEWATLQRHAGTLRVLEIVDGDPDGNVFRTSKAFDRSAASLNKLFRSCVNLRQLCMGGFGLEADTWKSHTGGIGFLLECISSLRNLRTLKLRRYPACLNGEIYVEGERQNIFEAQIRYHAVILANKMFHDLETGCPRLRVVVVEAWEMPPDDATEYFATFTFLRAAQTDMYGCTRPVAVEEPLYMIKHHEPCWDILGPDRFMTAC